MLNKMRSTETNKIVQQLNTNKRKFALNTPLAYTTVPVINDLAVNSPVLGLPAASSDTTTISARLQEENQKTKKSKTTATLVKITVSHDTGKIESLLDKEHNAMRAIIQRFIIGKVECADSLRLSGNQIVFWLHDLNTFDVAFDGADDLPENAVATQWNKEVLLTKCATQSILTILLQAECIKPTNLIFQVRPRGSFGGPILPIILNSAEGFRAPFYCKTSPVSHTNVYLDHNIIVFSLQPTTSQDEMAAMNKVLAEWFPQQCANDFNNVTYAEVEAEANEMAQGRAMPASLAEHLDKAQEEENKLTLKLK